MIYSPVLDLYFKHEKTVHDFFVQLMIILVAYLTDGFLIYVFRYNRPQISLLVFIAGYVGARYLIRRKGKQELFGGFANYGLKYAVFLGIAAWFIYLILIRVPKFR